MREIQSPSAMLKPNESAAMPMPGRSPSAPKSPTYPTTIASAMSTFATIALRSPGAVDQTKG